MPRPLDAPAAVRAALDRGAQRAHGRGGAQHVVALEQAVDLGVAVGQRAEDQRAVRDRLVARRRQRTRQHPGQARLERPGDGRAGL